MSKAFFVCWILAGAAFGNALAPTPAAAQKAPQGVKEGKLTVDSHTYSLRFAYAREIDDVEGVQAIGTGKKIIVLQLSDSELPSEAIGNSFLCDSLARAGKMNGVEIRYNAATGKMYGCRVYYSMEPHKNPSFWTTIGSSNATYLNKNIKIGPNMISGVALMTAPEEWLGSGNGGTPYTYRYEADFKAQIAHQPPVTANLAGATALGSAPAQALLAYEAACRKGDVQAAKRLSAPGVTADMEQFIALDGLQKYLTMIQSIVPNRATRLHQITRVVIRGNRASVVYKGQQGVASQSLIRTNGAWLVDH